MSRSNCVCRLVVAVIASCVLSSPSLAQGVDFTVDGVLAGPIPQAPWDQVPLGSTVELSVCFDTSPPDVDPSETFGEYPGAVTSVNIRIGDVEAESIVNGVNVIRVSNNEQILFGSIDTMMVEFELDGGTIGRLRLSKSVIGSTGPDVLDDDSLPTCEQIGAFGPSTLIFGLSQGQQDAIVLFGANVSACGACATPECFLVLGNGAGTVGSFTMIDHTFTTQVGEVDQWWSVLMEDIPEFVIWEAPPSFRATVQGLGSAGSGAQQPLGGAGAGSGFGSGHLVSLEDDPLPQVFFAQVLMWNPQVFPSNPEQYTHGLAVTVMPNGRVFTAPYGNSDGGLTLWAETEWNDQGQKVLRLPFSIPGF